MRFYKISCQFVQISIIKFKTQWKNITHVLDSLNSPLKKTMFLSPSRAASKKTESDAARNITHKDKFTNKRSIV